jgi:hypothetical protein
MDGAGLILIGDSRDRFQSLKAMDRKGQGEVYEGLYSLADAYHLEGSLLQKIAGKNGYMGSADEAEGIRKQALGRFRDLFGLIQLGAGCRHPD